MTRPLSRMRSRTSARLEGLGALEIEELPACCIAIESPFACLRLAWTVPRCPQCQALSHALMPKHHHMSRPHEPTARHAVDVGSEALRSERQRGTADALFTARHCLRTGMLLSP